MPIGVLVNALAIATGGILGTIAGGRLSQDFKEKLNMVFGCCSFAMGISSICLMENMPAVVFSVIIGTSIGATGSRKEPSCSRRGSPRYGRWKSPQKGLLLFVRSRPPC